MSKKNWSKLFNKKNRTHKDSYNFNNRNLDDIVDFGTKAYKYDGKRWKESKEEDEQELEMSDSYTVNNPDSFASSKALFDLNADLTSDISGKLSKSGGTLTGKLTLSAVNPQIDFNGTSDTGVDMAIKATPEGLTFFEPEQANKIHFEIQDDTGVNAPFGYKVGTTTVIGSDAKIDAARIKNVPSSWTDSGLPLTGKAADSDKLDGLDSSQFLRSDTSDTISGTLVVDEAVNSGIRVGVNSVSHVYLNGSGEYRPYVQIRGDYPHLELIGTHANDNHGSTIRFASDNDNHQMVIGSSSQNCKWLDFGYSAPTNYNPHAGISNSTSPTIMRIHGLSGNISIGSTTDGGEKLTVSGKVKATAFIGDGAGITGVNASTIRYDSNSYSAMADANVNIYTQSGVVQIGAMNTSHAHIYSDRPTFYLNKELLVNGNRVYHPGNDGSGSGLDADLLDGKQATEFLHTSAGQTGFEGGSRITSISNWNKTLPSGFYQGYNASNAPGGSWFNGINVRHSNTGNDHGFQLAMSYYDNNLWFRSYQGGSGNDNGTYQTWTKAATEAYVDDNAGGTITRASSEPAGAGDGDMWYDTSGLRELNVWQNGTDGWAWYPITSGKSSRRQFTNTLGAHGYGSAASWRKTCDEVNITTETITRGTDGVTERHYGSQGLSYDQDKAYAFGGNNANTTVWTLSTNTPAELTMTTGSRSGAMSSNRHDYSMVCRSGGTSDRFTHSTQTATAGWYAGGSTELGSFSDMNDTGYWMAGNNNAHQWDFVTSTAQMTGINTKMTSLDQAGSCEYLDEAIVQGDGNSNDNIYKFNMSTRVATHVADSSHQTGEGTMATFNGPSGFTTYILGGYSNGQGGSHGQNQYAEKYINATGAKTQLGTLSCDRSSGVGAGF